MEARLLLHNYVGTEHLLLGILHDDSSIPGRLLKEAGLSLDMAREKVREINRPIPEPEKAAVTQYKLVATLNSIEDAMAVAKLLFEHKLNVSMEMIHG